MVKCFFTAIFSSCIVAYIFKNFFLVPNGGNVISNRRVLAGYYLPWLPPPRVFCATSMRKKNPEHYSFAKANYRGEPYTRIGMYKSCEFVAFILYVRNTGL